MSSDDSSTTDSWASTIDSFDTTTSDSDSDSSDGGLNFAHLAAQAAGLVVQDEDGPSDDDDEDAWLRRENRPQTLAAAMLLLPGRRFVHETRHTPEQFEYMCTKLEVPDIIPTPEQRLHSSTMRKIKQLEGKLVFLLTVSRLAHPDPVQGQLENKWGYHRTEITKYTTACVDWLMDRWGHLLTFTAARVGPRVPQYAHAIGEKIGLDDPAQNRVFGFVDGVFLYTCRPRLFQESMYNGYYKGHGYKFQAVVTPDGLIGDLYGPEGGRHHDIFLWQMSRSPTRATYP